MCIRDRIIVETDRPVDAAVTDYLARKGYEAEGDRRDDGRAARFLRIAAGGVAGVGLVFSAMSFYILMLSIFLLLQKNSGKMENLLLLGYAPSQMCIRDRSGGVFRLFPLLPVEPPEVHAVAFHRFEYGFEIGVGPFPFVDFERYALAPVSYTHLNW